MTATADDVVPDEPMYLNGVFLWDERGYQLNGRPSFDLRDPKFLASSNPWLVVASALECAKVGNHQPIWQMLAVAKTASLGSLMQAALGLLGDAGTPTMAHHLLEFMQPQQPAYVRVKACSAALYTGYLWLVQPMLDTLLNIHPRERPAIALYLSWLLEEDSDVVASYEDFENPSDYADLVAEKIRRLERDAGPRTAFFRGRPLNMLWLTDKMISLLERAASDRTASSEFIYARHKFEAHTGLDCSDFYCREKLQRTIALQTLSEWRDSESLKQFEVGARYFFGHQINGVAEPD